MHPVTCTNIHHDISDLVNRDMVKNTDHNFSTKYKNSEPVPQMAHFEKLSFCSGGNL